MSKYDNFWSNVIFILKSESQLYHWWIEVQCKKKVSVFIYNGELKVHPKFTFRQEAQNQEHNNQRHSYVR